MTGGGRRHVLLAYRPDVAAAILKGNSGRQQERLRAPAAFIESLQAFRPSLNYIAAPGLLPSRLALRATASRRLRGLDGGRGGKFNS